jgi:outer membrane murein-binding lipoprotein Lpp
VASSVVSEKTTFSWPVVVVLSGCLLAVGGGMVRVEAIQRDADLLRARVDLLEHQQGADRGQLHTQGATLNEVKTLLMELRVDVRDALRTVVRTADHRE